MMEIQKEEADDLQELTDKIIAFFPNEKDRMSLFATILGAADNVSRFVIDTYKDEVFKLPPKCLYGLMHTGQVLITCAAILQDKVNPGDVGIGGYFPSNPDTAWKSAEDFEERMIILVKLFYDHYKSEGKIT